MANTKKSTASSSSALIDVLRSSGIDDTMIYNAVDEIRDMAGRNVFDALDSLEAKLTGMFRTDLANLRGDLNIELAHLRGDLNTQAAEIRTNRWILSIVLVLTVAFGLFKA